MCPACIKHLVFEGCLRQPQALSELPSCDLAAVDIASRLWGVALRSLPRALSQPKACDRAQRKGKGMRPGKMSWCAAAAIHRCSDANHPGCVAYTPPAVHMAGAAALHRTEHGAAAGQTWPCHQLTWTALKRVTRGGRELARQPAFLQRPFYGSFVVRLIAVLASVGRWHFTRTRRIKLVPR